MKEPKFYKCMKDRNCGTEIKISTMSKGSDHLSKMAVSLSSDLKMSNMAFSIGQLSVQTIVSILAGMIPSLARFLRVWLITVP